ncbi:MAG: carboxylesterase family protein [Pseudomonadales bacterium]
MKKALVIVIVIIGLVFIGSLFFEDTRQLPSMVDTTERTAEPSSTRNSPAGTFTGFADRYNTQAWLGIPFAQAPIGDLRWRAPRAITTTAQPLEALSYGSPCIQYWGPLSGLTGTEGEVAGDEDCLFLNIWAPTSDAQSVAQGDQRLPVMVWIHGGGNTIGTANTYQGHHLAGSQEVVFVALNYRMGVLGWLGHEAIRNTSETLEDASGNYGTLDMIAALKWVQKNISAFGGDPDNVTIFGESAGGRDTYSLIGSPRAAGLFHKAIVQSGSNGTTIKSRAENYRDDTEPGASLSSNEFINGVLVRQNRAENREEAKTLINSMSDEELIGFMRDQSVEQLFSAIETAGFGMYSSPQNLRDGHVLPLESLLERFDDPAKYNAVPMILGTNRDEAKVFLAQDPRFVSQWFGVIPRIDDQAVYDHHAAYLSDQWKALSVDEAALILSETQDDVYAYRFDWDESPVNWMINFPALLGAGHGLEISYVFGDFVGGISIPYLLSEENEPGRLALSDAMMNYWGEFAHNGKPGQGRDGKQAAWTPWNNDGDKMIVFDTEADGGIRMSDLLLTAESIKQRMTNDAMIANQEDLCGLYATLFIDTYQTTEFGDLDEYQNLGRDGCSAYDPYGFTE